MNDSLQVYCMVMDHREKKAVEAVIRKLPPGETETVYRAMPWGSKTGIRSANCFAYAFDLYEPKKRVKAQPGDIAARRRGFADRQAEAKATGARLSEELTCPKLRQKVLDDFGDKIYVEKADKPCKNPFWKVMIAIAPGKKEIDDYHTYREHKHLLLDVPVGADLGALARLYRVGEGDVVRLDKKKVFVQNANVWASKHGFATGALLTDTCGKPIFDPRKACRKVGKMDYKIMCDSFCIRK